MTIYQIVFCPWAIYDGYGKLAHLDNRYLSYALLVLLNDFRDFPLQTPLFTFSLYLKNSKIEKVPRGIQVE